MEWSLYRAWQDQDPQHRPEVSLADGYLAGAAVSLQARSDDLWVADILGITGTGQEAETLEPNEANKARDDLKRRLAETREQLASPQTLYAPVVAVSDEGDFDVAAWATGFFEAIGADLEMWLYHLAGEPGGGLLGILGTHVVGAVGDAARANLASKDERTQMAELKERSWEFIPGLLATLHRKKRQLADLST